MNARVPFSAAYVACVVALAACGDDPAGPPLEGTDPPSSPPPATVDLHVVTSTGGADPDGDGYTLRLDGSTTVALQPDDSVTLRGLDPGDHSLELENVAVNCSVEGGPTRSVTLVAGTAPAVEAFEVSCASLTGTLAVSAGVTGAGEDPDGFTLALDGEAAGPLRPGETAHLTVPVGVHSVALGGVDPNCSVEGGGERAVTVEPADTSRIAFAVDCDLKRGALTVATATTGWQHPGYEVRVVGPATPDPVELGPADRAVFGDLPVGVYDVALTAPPTCAGVTKATAEVEEGDTARVEFSLECAQPLGDLEVVTVTHGHDVDPDGYRLTLHGAREVDLPVAGTVEVRDLEAGTHPLSLSGVASHCQAEPGTPASVTIVAGTRTRLVLEVGCIWRSPVLLTPASGAEILQNDPTIPCSPHPTAGRGHLIPFDWTDVTHPSGVAYYEILVQREGAQLPAWDTAVPGSSLAALACHTFVLDAYLEGWRWRVRAVANDGEEGPWTGPGSFRFTPCRLDDGTPCHSN